jgi:hypothetical protein
MRGIALVRLLGMSLLFPPSNMPKRPSMLQKAGRRIWVM